MHGYWADKARQDYYSKKNRRKRIIKRFIFTIGIPIIVGIIIGNIIKSSDNDTGNYTPTSSLDVTYEQRQ